MSKKSCTFAPQKFKKLIFESMSDKQTKETQEKRHNPVVEYFTRLNGQVIVNDPALLL